MDAAKLERQLFTSLNALGILPKRDSDGSKQGACTITYTRPYIWTQIMATKENRRDYLSNSTVSFPLPSEITCTKWSVSTKGTLSLRTPNLLLKFPRMWPKSMWNSCKGNELRIQHQTVDNQRPVRSFSKWHTVVKYQQQFFKILSEE